jgi:hypothetical protein
MLSRERVGKLVAPAKSPSMRMAAIGSPALQVRGRCMMIFNGSFRVGG